MWPSLFARASPSVPNVHDLEKPSHSISLCPVKISFANINDLNAWPLLSTIEVTQLSGENPGNPVHPVYEKGQARDAAFLAKGDSR